MISQEMPGASRRRELLLAATLAVALVYSLWSARPLWSDVALLAVLAGAVRLTWSTWAAAAPAPLRAPALAFAGAYVLAAALSRESLTAWRSVLGLVAYGLIFLLAGNLLAWGVGRAQIYRALVLTAQVIVAALVAGWLADGAPLWGYRLRFERNNSFALFNLLLFPALLVGACRRLVLAGALWVAWFSASRGGMAGLLAGLATLPRGIALLVRHRGAVAALGLVLTLGLAARPDLWQLNARGELWTVAGRMFAGSPLVGQGPNTFKGYWMAAGLHPYDFGHAHNLPLNVAAELGLAGLAAGAWLVASVLRALVQTSGLWAAAGLAATAALLVHSLGDVPTTAPYIVVTWLVVVRLGLERADAPA